MRNCLLDTHALIWATDPHHPFHTHVKNLLDGVEKVWVSAVSAWEISTKTRLGKLTTEPDLAAHFGKITASHGFSHLALDYRHAQLSGNFTAEHRDPFDRMLAAQSQLEKLLLVTKDPAFKEFGTETLW